MGYSRTGWTAKAIAPWCLGMALAVSMSADAGQEAASGASFAPLPWRAPAPPAVLVPAQPPALGLDFGTFPGEALKLLRQASLSIGDGEEFKRLPDEIEPRADLKHNARRFPEVDRSNKGDPLAGLRPAFDTRLRDSKGLASFRADDLIFRHDETRPANAIAVPNDEASGPDSGFEPWPAGDSPVTAHSSAEASPGQDGSAMTMRPAAIDERLMQGATPAIRRAITLGSATPAPARFGAGRGRGAPRDAPGARHRAGGAAKLRGAHRSGQIGAGKSLPCRSHLFRSPRRIRGRSGGGWTGCLEPGLERALSGDDLRRCLPKPAAFQRLPVLICLRRQIPAHRRTRGLAAGRPHRGRSDKRQDL